ncbi:TPA: helix-turn-helix domain-containing protein [Candidatus Woesearchaeota archaeon]|nr:MAG: Fumarate lyase [archaeon GW2011_AR11]HIH05043.1 helix-turn-helix domain-containing protein [Candidatus Woesearchaeota archaeon]HII63887.1 helix-turn-helix domain-containing protein [Candidatus Woesearchaeota archaeon]
MDLPGIFTKTNLEILALLGKEKLHIREIAERLGCSPAKVHGCIATFREHGLTTERWEKNRKIIILNEKSGLLQAINQLMKAGKGEREGGPTDTLTLFDAISPLDYRYYGRNEKAFEELRPYLSEAGFIRYACKAEAALTNTLARLRVCSKGIAREVEAASKQVTPEEVYLEEDRIKHNIRALANAIRSRVSGKARPYVHFTTTSHDIICTADAARFKDFSHKVLVPKLIGLERTLIGLSLREKHTLQIGRTHGQHAEPITFGFAIAQYVSRLGTSITSLEKSASNLRGKVAGAVGAYNASSLFFSRPEEFERLVLAEMGLKPSPISTQVVEAEYMTRFVNDAIAAFGVLANLSDDMRHLQRSEIAEVGEHFEAKQVGSSTMPQKRNPINFENVKSMWKEFMPRMVTVYSDQISEHQRDLTNSASSRFVPEILAALYLSADRLDRIMARLAVDTKSMKRNFGMSREFVIAEPLYILLAAHGHPDAHEYVREKTLESQRTGIPVRELVGKDKAIRPYLRRLTAHQREILNNPELYTGIAAKKTESVCSHWKRTFRRR